MRRNDTQSIGTLAETFAESLLAQRGFEVCNLNKEQSNYPLYDLAVVKNRKKILVSIKCARAKRELRLGRPRMLAKMGDDCVVMAFLPDEKGKEIEFSYGGYELLIIPGRIARDEALAAHNHYGKTHPGSADHSVMVKDKVDRNERTRSGAVFKSWHERFLNAWDTFDAVVRSRG
jgi:hypothetical protein